ncbi:Chemotaxis related glutamate methyltransferase [Lysobacter dokdonensis DS-58]|uniref:protein-glutamate methylesterase n=1 Tax=Lysobacter dokdonensis DS-58 TaxID=1300345 RepID=A0A0A2WEU2_9GAMM|nr:chemotaxis protein CheB [Lysobacter dokdonensis]KGQ18706.1 Chemotaxis related glutamate methyltransferase [Lysobacter dokdonensis DS-58]
MAESSPRVALLARPGEACERLRAALRDAGGDVVIEADPSVIDPQALRIAGVETVLVALDPAVEDALEKFDDVLADRAIEVIFDEADLAARREGWDAARWVRHLAAKLHRHDDVLPPGREPDSDPLPRAARLEKPEDRHADADIATFVAEADDLVAHVPAETAIGESMIAFAPVEATESNDAIDSLEALEFDMPTIDTVVAMPEVEEIVDMPVVEAAQEETFSFELPNFDEAQIEVPAVATAAEVQGEVASEYGALSFTDDINDLDFAGDTPAFESPAPAFRESTQDFDALLRDLGNAPSETLDAVDMPIELPTVREFAPKEDLPSMGFDIAPIDAPPAPKQAERVVSFRNLSLEDLTDAPAATPRLGEAPVAAQFKSNLDALEKKISSLAIVGSGASSDDHHGVVLILAGIGGPDAVRQILTALPAGFPRAVLISQRLDGGRYDRLVQQMARAAILPVHLADGGTKIQPGNVYIVPPDLGLDGTHGLSFAQGFSLLDALPSDDSAVLMLSGADPALVDSAMSLAGRGALVAGQSPDGCYDAAAPMALTARGATSAAPQELVQSLLQRWPA